MINIDNNGSLTILTKNFRLYSNSYYGDFCLFFKPTLTSGLTFVIADLHKHYFLIEVYFKCLPDFCYIATFFDVEFEFSNVAYDE